MKKQVLPILVTILIMAGCQRDCERKLAGYEAEKQQLVANKKMVTDLYQELFGDKDVSVIGKYIAEEYVQHNPMVADGRQALINAVSEWFKGAKKERIDIQHIAADKDLVFIHTKGHNGSKVISVIDIFRISNGKIVEHWDVMQEVPEKAANSHPMF